MVVVLRVILMEGHGSGDGRCMSITRDELDMEMTLACCFSRRLVMGMGSTHHLEGVGEGKAMVLGVGLMLSLFVFDR